MIAHGLTGLRLLAVAPAAWAFAHPDRSSVWLLATLLTVAIVSDYFDGVVARATGTASARGMLFDHTTDFLFVTAGLAGASLTGVVPTILPLLIVVAFSQYVLDSYLLHRQKRLRMSTLGRSNGILYFAPLVQIAIARVEDLPVLPGVAAAIVGPSCLLLVVSTVASIVDRAVAPLRARSD